MCYRWQEYLWLSECIMCGNQNYDYMEQNRETFQENSKVILKMLLRLDITNNIIKFKSNSRLKNHFITL